ncbi:WD40 repeat-like protein [Hanseniaspora valbyensis NRRL Y-1626]|uniref:WD40 repeat-like protein n=1 Tax=Hanseniaspora valbyensis NRRL Y-1626 TaxID=766949 RepID=A0A1B7T7U1_9ASCO|nr:WD40 repeat-like protein [Hanseniaspora valbyensis NRRL Y-1626]
MKPFITGHEDLVHDIKYDYYGRQLATCSSDLMIKIFTLSASINEWELTDSFKAHDSNIVSLDWCAPEFGRLLISGSYDGLVKIWEETSTTKAINNESNNNNKGNWQLMAKLSDTRSPVFNCKFSPSFLGLNIGVIGHDSQLRVYYCSDPSNVSSWELKESYNLIPEGFSQPVAHLQSDYSLDWCKSKFLEETLVCSCLDLLSFMQKDPLNNNKLVKILDLYDHNGLIREVAWAPSMGRSYELVATACQDGYVRIFKVTGISSNGSDEVLKKEEHETENKMQKYYKLYNSQNFKVELISKNNDHKGEVWSVAWNLTGTVLSSAGDDGKIRLWKQSHMDHFQCVSVITPDK